MKQIAAIALMVVSSLFVLAGQASAQDSEGGSAKIEGPLQEQLEPYWSVDRDLEVLRNKLYTKEGKFSIGLMGGIIPSEPFYDYFTVGGRLGYFFTDQMGVEVTGSYLLPSNTTLTSFLEDERVDSFNAEKDGLDQQQWRANAMFMWHPLYGKWALLQRKLSHFDLNVGVGAGVVGVKRPDISRNQAEATSEVLPEGVIGMGMHFFLMEELTLRFDTRVYFHQGPEFDTSDEASARGFYDRLEVPVDFLLGVSYSI